MLNCACSCIGVIPFPIKALVEAGGKEKVWSRSMQVRSPRGHPEGESRGKYTEDGHQEVSGFEKSHEVDITVFVERFAPKQQSPFTCTCCNQIGGQIYEQN